MSDYIIEEVLSIKCKNGKQKPMVYFFKLLNKTKYNYKIHNKKILVIIRELEI